MSEKLVTRREQDPRILTVSEIRARVEDLAEELAQRMRPTELETFPDGFEAYRLDNRQFIELMADYVELN